MLTISQAPASDQTLDDRDADDEGPPHPAAHADGTARRPVDLERAHATDDREDSVATRSSATLPSSGVNMGMTEAITKDLGAGAAVDADGAASVRRTLDELLQAAGGVDVAGATVEISVRMADAAAAIGRFTEAWHWTSIGLGERGMLRIPNPDAFSALYRVRTLVHLERDECQAAAITTRDMLTNATAHRTHRTFVRALLAAARCAAVNGRTNDTRSLLDEARRTILDGPVDDALQRELTIVETGALLRMGEVAHANLWLPGLEQYALTDPMSDARRIQLLTASGEHHNLANQAVRLVRSLREDTPLLPRVVVGASSAAALAASGRANDALILFCTTLVLAEQEGFVQTITDHADGLRPMLEDLVAGRVPAGHAIPATPYLLRLRTAMDRSQEMRQIDLTNDRGSSVRDGLSEREMQVLRLLAGTMSNREIGSELYLSVNTVKSHVKNLYAKLGVNRRSEAVSRARELGLLRH